MFLLLYVALRLVFHGGRHGRPGTPKYDSNEKEEEAGTVRWWDWLNDTTLSHIDES